VDLIDQSGGGSKESEANESREEINNHEQLPAAMRPWVIF